MGVVRDKLDGSFSLRQGALQLKHVLVWCCRSMADNLEHG